MILSLLFASAMAQSFTINVPPVPVQINGSSCVQAAPGAAVFNCTGGTPQCPSPPGPGPCSTPPPTGCSGFTKTISMTMDWNNPSRLYTKDFGGMGPNDAVVVTFTTGSATSPTNNLPRFVAAEWQSQPSTRIAVMSPKPCDWGAQAWTGGSTSGATVTIPFTVGNPSNYGYYMIVPTNTTYYFNVKNDSSPSCASNGVCDLAVDLNKAF